MKPSILVKSFIKKQSFCRSHKLLALTLLWAIWGQIAPINGQAIEKGMAVVTQYADTNNTSNLVAKLYDTRNNSLAPFGYDWYTQDHSIDITPSSWTLSNLGEIFGIAIDSIGDVFFASSDVYHLDSTLASGYNSYRGPAGPAGIYRADAAVLSNLNILISTHPAATPQASPSTTIPNTGGIGNGLGNIAYDQKHHQLFASNLEDGRIYRISLTSTPPQVVSIYDPLTPDDGATGIAPRQEQIWGIGVFTDTAGITRVYFARRALPPTISSEIHSIPLQSNGEFGGASIYHNGIYEGGSTKEITLSTPTSDTSRITDIAFAEDGRMLLSERGHPHRASIYEYHFDGSSWVPTANSFYTGSYNILFGLESQNAAGGIDYGYRQRGGNVYGQCDSIVWASSNYILSAGSGSGFYYGIQGIKASGNLPVHFGTSGNGFTDWIIDLDGQNTGNPQIGDVEIYRSSCATSWSGPINHILACNDLLQVSLGVDGTIRLNADIVTQGRGTNPCWVFEIFTPHGDVIPGALLTCEWVGETLDYQVKDTCNNNSCWGKIKLEDKYIPPILCKNDTIRCHQSTLPDSIGFPIPPTAKAYPTAVDQRYTIEHWDSCGIVSLWYTDDQLTDFDCSSDYKVIVRRWDAEDAYGNTTRCFDTIRIKRPTVAEDLLPVPDTVLYCGGNWEETEDGAPAPVVTGSPIREGCDWITTKYTDDITSTCGNAFRVLRKWTITDWCAKGALKVKEVYQSIDVRDTTAPTLTCPSPSEVDTVSTGRYSCTAAFELPIPNRPNSPIHVTDLCSGWKYRIKHIPHRRWQPGVQDPANAVWLGGFKRPDEAPFYATGLDLGKHWFEYEIVDDCNNKSICTVTRIVADQIAPDIVCEGHTQISLNDNGTHRLYATSLDDGTTDNCQMDTFAVRRLDHKRHCGQENIAYHPFISFCCDDVGKTIMVELLAVDKAGNASTCMVEVEVGEKIAPTIIPPTDLTIDCRYDFDLDDLDSYFGKIATDDASRKNIYLKNDGHYSPSNNWLAGKDGLAYDNCGPITITDSATVQLECGSGTIVRTFTVTDAAQLTASATQTITIEDLTPFTEKDIHWPKDVLDPPFETDCTKGIDTRPSTKTRVDSAYGFRNLDCAHIAVTYSDKIFYEQTDACFKIIRTWTVVDWCTYEKNGREEWEHTQLIKVANHIPPVISSATCRDTIICDSSAFIKDGICSGRVQFSPMATDDCTPSGEIQWSYRLDEGNSGTFGPLVKSSIFNRVLPIGVHRVKWFAEDGCGNVSSCIKTFEIKECKPPTPYCRDEIVTVVMPNSGSIAVTAKRFDIGAYDNCSADEDIVVSFTPDGQTSQLIFTCADLRGRSVLDTLLSVYFIDESGNSEHCDVHVKIQANGHCAGNNLSISGTIETFNGSAIDDVHLTLYSKGANQPIAEQDADGAYRFDHLRGGKDYEIRTTMRTDWRNSINTRDLVAIKKHLLSVTDLDEAWEYIAADVNNSKTISTADILHLRKLILGKTHELSKSDSWVFYDNQINLDDLKALQDNKGVLYVNDLQSDDKNAHLVGIKIGDVTGEINGVREDPSNNPLLNVHLSTHTMGNGHIVYDFISDNNILLEGIQGTIELPGKIIAIYGGRLAPSPEEYHIFDSGIATYVWFDPDGRSISRGDTLLHIESVPLADDHTGRPATISSNITLNRVFAVDGPSGILSITSRANRSNEDLVLYLNRPNPASTYSDICFENQRGDNVQIRVYDIRGKLLFAHEMAGKKGYSEYRLPVDRIMKEKGVILYSVTIGQQTKTGKIIIQ